MGWNWACTTSAAQVEKRENNTGRKEQVCVVKLI